MATEGSGKAHWEVKGTVLGQDSAAGDVGSGCVGPWGSASQAARCSPSSAFSSATPPCVLQLGVPRRGAALQVWPGPRCQRHQPGTRVAAGARCSVRMGAAFIPLYLIAVYKIVFVYRINCGQRLVCS